MAEPDESAEARAHALVTRIFALLHECRAILRELEVGAPAQTRSAEGERHLYLALLGALEAGLVRTMGDALTVLRHASRPLGPMGAEWLEAQERQLRPPGAGDDQ